MTDITFDDVLAITAASSAPSPNVESVPLAWEPQLAPVFSEDGTEIEGYRQTVRSDTGTTLGVVSDRYAPLAHSALRSLVRSIGDVEKITAREWGGGARVALQAEFPRLPSVEVTKGDVIQVTLSATTSHDGSSGTRAVLVVTRLKCLNGQTVANQTSLSIRHTGDQHAKLAIVSRDIVRAMDSVQTRAELWRRMATTRAADRTSIERYWQHVLRPVVRRAAAEGVTGSEAFVAELAGNARARDLDAIIGETAGGHLMPGLLDRLTGTFNAEAYEAGPTQWAAYNSVTAHLSHGRGSAPARSWADATGANGAIIARAESPEALDILAGA